MSNKEAKKSTGCCRRMVIHLQASRFRGRNPRQSGHEGRLPELLFERPRPDFTTSAAAVLLPKGAPNAEENGKNPRGDSAFGKWGKTGNAGGLLASRGGQVRRRRRARGRGGGRREGRGRGLDLLLSSFPFILIFLCLSNFIV